MPNFAGVNHVALTVTDLDVSERFYVESSGFRRALDVGYGRITIHAASGFTIALLTAPGCRGRAVHRADDRPGPPRLHRGRPGRAGAVGGAAAQAGARTRRSGTCRWVTT